MSLLAVSKSSVLTCSPLCVQVPLRLAWAMTFYKAQGNEFDRVTVDLHNIHSHAGHAYTALSRARSLAGLRVVGGAPWCKQHLPDHAIRPVSD